MEIVFLPKAEEDMAYWIKTGDKTILKKIAQLEDTTFEKSSRFQIIDFHYT